MSDFASEYATDLEDRFLRYVRIDTESDSRSPGVPSTRKQFDLLNLLKRELEQLGASDVRTTENGFTIATIPATVEVDTPRLAFLAHVDTAAQFNGAGVRPLVHRGYDGSPIVLPDDHPRCFLRMQIPISRRRSAKTSLRLAAQLCLGPMTKLASLSS